MSRPATTHVRRLSQSQRRQLDDLFRNPPDARVHERALAIRMSSQREGIARIAQTLRRSRSSIWRWIKDFNAAGIAALYISKSPGTPPKADEDVYAALGQAVESNPRDLGYPFTRWTAALLVEHIRRVLHVQLSVSTMRRILHRLGYRYLRPKLDLKHKQDPAQVKRAKRQKTMAKKKSTPAPVVILWRFSTRRNSTSIPS